MPRPPGAPVRILVTNDDGLGPGGVVALAARLERDGHDVVVAVPDRDVSGCGTGIGGVHLDRSIDVRTERVEGLAEPVYLIPGTPGLAVMAGALGAFGPRPDLVVSGINAGRNVGTSVIHSGTVGGALTGATFGIAALAVSAASRGREGPLQWEWDDAADVAALVAEWMLHLNRHLTINLNLPARTLADMQGLRWAPLAEFGTFVLAATDGDGEARAQLRMEELRPAAPGSDRALLDEGYATVTALAPLEHSVAGSLPPLPELTGLRRQKVGTTNT